MHFTNKVILRNQCYITSYVRVSMELDGQARSLFNSTQYFSCAYILEDTRSFESHVGLR